MLSKDMDAIPGVPYAMARLGVPGGLGTGKSKASDWCLVKHCGCICCPARAAVRWGVRTRPLQHPVIRQSVCL